MLIYNIILKKIFNINTWLKSFKLNNQTINNKIFIKLDKRHSKWYIKEVMNNIL